MYNKIVIVMDMEKEILGNVSDSEVLLLHLRRLLGGKDMFNHVIGIVQTGGNYMMKRSFGWDIPEENFVSVHKDIAQYIDEVVEKNTFSCINGQFLNKLMWSNHGKLPEFVFLCGVETDTSILKTATDLFECGIQPIILSKYCSSKYTHSHLSGLRCLDRLIGDQFIWNGEFNEGKELDEKLSRWFHQAPEGWYE